MTQSILLKGRQGSILIEGGRISATFPNYSDNSDNSDNSDASSEASASIGSSLSPSEALSVQSGTPEAPAYPEFTKVIDVGDCLICPGFTDIHVHFREPGFSYKETVATGSAAAARGGYTCVCAMPNLQPVPDCPESIEMEWELIRRDAIIDVLPYAAITKGRRGEELVDFKLLKDSAVAFSDDGSGVQSGEMMRKAMLAAKEAGVIVAAHCEDESLLRGGYIHDGQYCREHGHRGICAESEWAQIERDLALCAQTGCRYHVCHISCKESVELIRSAKARGVRVSCETAPHYLLLCDEDLQEDGRWKMNPPLRSSEDRDALVEGLRDGTIDAVATDHAPHSEEEKSLGLAKSAMGIVGLETAFAALYTGLVRTGKLSLSRLVEALTSGPRIALGLDAESDLCAATQLLGAERDSAASGLDVLGQADEGGFFGLRAGDAANIAIIDLEEKYIVDSKDFASKGHATPFEGKELQGKVKMTIYNGKTVWTDGSLG